MMDDSIEKYIDEIDVQSKKPLKEQLYDLKVAGAKFLVALDKIIEEMGDER